MVRKLAPLAVAVLLLGNGAAFASPSSSDETSPLSLPVTESRVVTGASGPAVPFPSSSDEVQPFTFAADAMDVAPESLGVTYGSAIPSSASEVGPAI